MSRAGTTLAGSSFTKADNVGCSSCNFSMAGGHQVATAMLPTTDMLLISPDAPDLGGQFSLPSIMAEP